MRALLGRPDRKLPVLQRVLHPGDGSRDPLHVVAALAAHDARGAAARAGDRRAERRRRGFGAGVRKAAREPVDRRDHPADQPPGDERTGRADRCAPAPDIAPQPRDVGRRHRLRVAHDDAPAEALELAARAALRARRDRFDTVAPVFDVPAFLERGECRGRQGGCAAGLGCEQQAAVGAIDHQLQRRMGAARVQQRIAHLGCPLPAHVQREHAAQRAVGGADRRRRIDDLDRFARDVRREHRGLMHVAGPQALTAVAEDGTGGDRLADEHVVGCGDHGAFGIGDADPRISRQAGAQPFERGADGVAVGVGAARVADQVDAAHRLHLAKARRHLAREPIGHLACGLQHQPAGVLPQLRARAQHPHLGHRDCEHRNQQADAGARLPAQRPVSERPGSGETQDHRCSGLGRARL